MTQSTGNDYSQLAQAQGEMMETSQKLMEMPQSVGMARQVVEIAADRRKKALAEVTVLFLDGDLSHNEAETRARASEEYSTAMKKILSETAAAEAVLTRFTVLRSRLDALRTLVSSEKTLAGMI